MKNKNGLESAILPGSEDSSRDLGFQLIRILPSKLIEIR